MAWSKKSEKIEVRLTQETKQNFLETCEQQGKSASSVIRELIEGYVSRFHTPILKKPIEIVRKTPLWGKLSACGVAFMSMAVFAVYPSQASEPAQWEKNFQEKDENSDGALEFEEIRFKYSNPENPEIAARAQKQTDEFFVSVKFDAMDVNKDQMVSKQEYQNHFMANRRKEFNGFDNDGDGIIMLTEFIAPASREAEIAQYSLAHRVNSYDADILKQRVESRAAGDTKTVIIQHPRGYHQAQIGQVFRTIDLNNDGKLEFAEYADLDLHIFSFQREY